MSSRLSNDYPAAIAGGAGATDYTSQNRNPYKCIWDQEVYEFGKRAGGRGRKYGRKSLEKRSNLDKHQSREGVAVRVVGGKCSIKEKRDQITDVEG